MDGWLNRVEDGGIGYLGKVVGEKLWGGDGRGVSEVELDVMTVGVNDVV